MAFRRRSWSGRSSSAYHLNPSSAAAPFAVPGTAASPPPATSSLPTNLHFPSSAATNTADGATLTYTSSITRPPQTPSSNLYVARLDRSFCLAASCDGLVILSRIGTNTCKYICNPNTREHAPLPQTRGFRLLGMYPHQPTGEYRLLLHKSFTQPKGQIGFYILTLGSEQSPKYIEAPKATMSSESVYTSALVRDSLHWYPHYLNDSKSVLVFDCTTESFRRIRAPVVSTYSYTIFEMDNALGIYGYNADTATADIWVL